MCSRFWPVGAPGAGAHGAAQVVADHRIRLGDVLDGTADRLPSDLSARKWSQPGGDLDDSGEARHWGGNPAEALSDRSVAELSLAVVAPGVDGAVGEQRGAR